MVEIPQTEVQGTPEQIRLIAEHPSFRDRFNNVSRYALAGFFAGSLALSLACSPTRAERPSAGAASGPGITQTSELTPSPASEEIILPPPPDPEPTPPPEPLTKVDLLAQVDEAINIVQSINVDEVLANLPPDTPDRSPRAIAKQNINQIVYGIDPKAYALGGITDRKYEPESLLGLKDLIANSEYVQARELIVKIATGPVRQNIGPPETDDIIIRKPELDEIDPEFKFHSPTGLGLSLSKIKLDVFLGLVGIYYFLA